MGMRTLLFLTIASLMGFGAAAANAASLTGHCASLQSSALQACFESESKNIQEANIPNEVVVSVNPEAKQTLVMLMTIVENRNNAYAQQVAALKSTVLEAKAFALIVNYQDEPRLYYYAVAADGSYSLVFDGLNMIDLPYENLMFHPDPSRLYFQDQSASSILKEWIKTIYEE
ncbi:hypothetical protein D3C87_1173570 [compost metagenome]